MDEESRGLILQGLGLPAAKVARSMMLFLKIVAGFVVAIILVGLIVYFWIRRKLKGFGGKIVKQMMEQLELASMGGPVPPFRLHLKTVNEEEDIGFARIDDVERLTAEFLEAGFEIICDFQTVEIPLAMRAFRHGELNVYGVIYDHPIAGVFCDVTRRYRDQTSWTASSSQHHGMDPAPGSHPTFMPDSTVEKLLNKLIDDSPVNDILPATREDFVVRFESAYAREMNFRIERGGPTVQEIQRIAEINGQECDQQQIDAVQKQWKMAISDFLSEKAIAMWKKEQEIPAPVFARMKEQLIAIHNRFLPEQLMELVFPDFDVEVDDEDFDEDAQRQRALFDKLSNWMRSSTAAEAFQKLLNAAGVASEWQHQGSAAKPVPAEIWLRPLDADDDEQEHDDTEYDEELEV